MKLQLLVSFLCKENKSMSTYNSNILFKTLTKAIGYAAGIIILLWVLYKIANVILVLLFAMVLAIIINNPISKIEKKKVPRIWASLIVFGVILIVVVLLGWLIVPKISEQLQALIADLPNYITTIEKNVSGWFSDYPDIQNKLQPNAGDLSKWIPSLPETFLQIGNFSLNFLKTVVLLIIFISMIVYAVTNPKPLVETYFSFFRPDQRNKAATALLNASGMLVGWFRANLIGGGIEAVCVSVFLSAMNVPGALVWGGLAFFSELIPKIGFYIMAIPPALVALSVSPLTALWVVIFFLVMDEIIGDFIMPKLRSSTMNIHPVSSIFLLLAMGAAFGITGALLATPMAAIIKAYYEEFYVKKLGQDTEMKKRVDAIVYNDNSVEKSK
jgi:predicted PurR-regulated permease PerM